MNQPSPTRAPCPRCHAPGRKVPPETPRALLRPAARARLGAATVRFCRTPSCDVVYFEPGAGTVFTTADVRVPVYQKSDDPARPVCYCFGHTVGAIEAEVAATGASRVPDEITAACRAGRDDCPHENPQGACCLGNVRQVVRAAQRARGAPVETSPTGTCCTCEPDGGACDDASRAVPPGAAGEG